MRADGCHAVCPTDCRYPERDIVWLGLSMDRRRQHNRITVDQRALLISGDITLEVVIDDLSEDGVSVSTHFSEPLIKFGPETLLTLTFQPTTRETLNLQCRVKWVKPLPHGSGSRIGMEIINPPWEQSKSFL